MSGSHSAQSVATCVLDDVVYCVHVMRGEDGRTTIQFSSSHPPHGLDALLYQWHGRLTTAPTPAQVTRVRETHQRQRAVRGPEPEESR